MRCPVCRAENTEETCRRCKADLSLLAAVETRRQNALAQAAWAAGHGQGRQTVQFALLAKSLRAGADASQWLALGYLLQRDFFSAWRLYRSLTLSGS